MTAESLKRPHYPALDGLRGVAILLVVLYHNFDFIKQSFFGWLGVDLFFVLSGFLITSILMDDIGKAKFLKNFFTRRVLRIFPLYFLCLIIFLILFPLFNWHKKELAFFLDNQWWLWTYLQNWLYSFRLTDDAKMLTHLWSLAVEEQFYLIWPFVILLVKKPKRLFFIMLALLLLTMAARSVIWLYQVEDLNYTTLYTFTRIDGICIGSMIALLMRFRPTLIGKNMAAIVLALAAMNFIFYFLNRSSNSYPFLAFVGYTTFCAMFGLLVYEIVTNSNSLFTKLLSIQPLRFFGKISYGFYIFHWPIYLMTREYLLAQTGSRLGTALLSTALALLISIISYYSFERYFLALKDKFK
ncbi:MAG TPA: acyltransferase [Chitinophagaceae bacterium]